MIIHYSTILVLQNLSRWLNCSCIQLHVRTLFFSVYPLKLVTDLYMSYIIMEYTVTAKPPGEITYEQHLIQHLFPHSHIL